MISDSSHLKYAKALYKIASEAGADQRVLEDLRGLTLLMKDADFASLIKRIAYMEASKLEAALKQTLHGKLHELTMNLVMLLARARKLGILSRVYDTYSRLYHEAKNIQELWVKTARPLSGGELSSLIEKLQKVLNKPVSVELEVQKDLIGGVQIFERGYLTDYSVKNYLEMMRKHLLS